MDVNNKKRRSGLSIMGKLIGLVKPLLPVMLLAIFLGVIGFLCAIFLTIIAGEGIINIIASGNYGTSLKIAPIFMNMSIGKLSIILIIIAVARGFLHYGEQYCNHLIAFKLLAIIRHGVFEKLRALCPAKLEGRGKGDLISIITSDIELLEVFYAHTLSPIAIATIVSFIMIIFIGRIDFSAGVLALAAYLTVGVFIPLWNGKKGAKNGMKFRNAIGNLNSFVLESLYGIDETIQYDDGEKRKREIDEKSKSLGKLQKKLSRLEASQKSITNLVILLFSLAMLFLTLSKIDKIGFSAMLIATISMMGSFGPVVALSNLSNNLNQTLASGERVLSLLEENVKVEEISGNEDISYEGAEVSNIDFSYDDEQILKNYSISFPKGKIIGIHGPSGSGKSTLLKLLMRFWKVDGGSIKISDRDIEKINTSNLRDIESYVTQETWLFHDTIANNIAVGKLGATKEEIEEAAKKASIHEFIMSLPSGYDTQIGELGDTLSGGERQRIGIARAFLHNAPLMLLDEPTSNLDSLNEAIILKALKESYKDETVVLVSHRNSTMGICDVVYEMDSGRIS